MIDTGLRLREYLDTVHTVAIAVHEKPDGDACGGAVACAVALQEIGKKTVIWDRFDFPEHYTWLYEQVEDTDEPPDCVLILDSGDMTRVSDSSRAKIGTIPVINIDHHADNTHFGVYNFVDANASSVSEMIFFYIQSWNIALPLAFYEAVYTGIMTDTGNFAYSNTTACTLKAASSILTKIGNPASIYRKVWASYKPGSLVAFGRILSRAKTFANDRLVVSYCTLDDCAELVMTYADIEHAVNFLGNIKNSEVFILIKETSPTTCRVSLRSAGVINVAEFARAHEGGGHAFAAGATVHGTVEESMKYIVSKWSAMV